MGNNEARVVGTCGVWLAVLVVSIAAIVTNTTLGGVLVFLIIAIMAGVAAGATQAIWNGGQKEAQQTEKAKRHSRVERVLQGMDEGELDELRARLMADSDGEAVSLEELMTERERRRH